MCSSMKLCSFFWSDLTLSENSNSMIVTSLSGESGGSLFHEVGDAFLEILALQTLDHFFLGGLESLRQRLKHCVVDLILDHAHRSRAHIVSEIFGVSIDAIHETGLGENPVHQAHPQSFVRVDET